MNKYICFASVVFALIACGSCGKIYAGNNNGYASNYGSNYDDLAAVPANLYSGPSYGSEYAAPAPAAVYAAPKSYSKPSYGGAPKFTTQPIFTTELYPGQQNYQAYNSPAVYSQLALPVVPSVPVAKLYVPAEKSYGPSYSGPSYGGSSYGGSSYGSY